MLWRIPTTLPNLHDFDRIVFFTGAGLSAEAGIPTYRGKGGIWEQYNYEDFACQRAFNRDPEKVWDFHDKRRAFVAGCLISEGYRIIREIEIEKPGTAIITQNIDGVHQRAGSEKVIELHGSLWRIRCDREKKIWENKEIPLLSRKCSCGGYVRPDIVWFEDPLNHQNIEDAFRRIIACDILITIGTSGVVFPAAQLPVYAIQRGIPTIEINIEDTPFSEIYEHTLRGTASEMLKKIWF